ncbi:DNA glycosylase AlkZ-like family protein [Rariglobus hedericola]|uniref:Winged helix-turn-helix domain-containing protein n=1 Tax=Rariglobus hedericola TaxID=2597822 RepID=A0A556QRS9_9BACT|nr:crosslink repair DNA glycosylase YcaQ family protein [Rariglobus hedericola]TSJ79346.1 winged helix-turn-helix domain-containing protein [Rariglobus hedericola]
MKTLLPEPIKLSPGHARWFALHALGLVEAHASIAGVLAHHGYVQIDPINVCGRMHDLILRSRLSEYREGDLLRFVHGESASLAAEQRTAFEHHLPSTGILVVLENSAWPYLQVAMRARSRRAGAWSGKLTAREAELAPRLLAELSARGPLGSDMIDDPRAGVRTWGTATLVKATLQKLFFHGRILIARREAGRRLYDLPERVLPAAVLRQGAASPDEVARWETLLKLRQRRLTPLKRGELAHVADLVQPIRVEGAPLLYALRSDAELIERAAGGITSAGAASARLLAPLDPLIYDRTVTRALWGFDYTWEVYTSPLRRRRGYYALPLLSGDALVGHVDPKADRKAGKLQAVSREVKRGYTKAANVALKELARFLELR